MMHAGFDAHAVGESTTPSIGYGDGLLAFSSSGETPVTLHLARLAHNFGANILAVTTQAKSRLAALAKYRIVLSTAGTDQFGGTLFEQSALLTLDAIILDLTSGDSRAFDAMQGPAR